ncbi:hypothetical protein [Beijerinckia indica]|uniref:hypothetical protein n=1 Tax=Beijerinckia indica TaxID=533 RepID=UPI0011D0806C|nr:hypothetical protein [Beijerinckia indica]
MPEKILGGPGVLFDEIERQRLVKFIRHVFGYAFPKIVGCDRRVIAQSPAAMLGLLPRDRNSVVPGSPLFLDLTHYARADIIH